MTRAIRWWLSAPVPGGTAAAIVVGVWLALATLVSMPGVATH